MPYLELTIDIYEPHRLPLDDDFATALHDLLEQYYPQAYDISIEFSDEKEPDGSGWRE